MPLIQNKVIHRFVRPISDYEIGGSQYTKLIPLDSQAYAYYSDIDSDKVGLYYVLGDGQHTYLELRDGKSNSPSSKEYPVITKEILFSKLDTLIPGEGVVISGTGPTRKISVPAVITNNKFIHPLTLASEVTVGHTVNDINLNELQTIDENAIPKENDLIYTASNHQLLITSVDYENNKCHTKVVNCPSEQIVTLFKDIVGNPSDNFVLSQVLDEKLDKNTTPNTLYGVDEDGNQVVYHISDVGIQDAPKDDLPYLRKNGEWVEYKPVNLEDFSEIDDEVVSEIKTYSSSKIQDLLQVLISQIDELSQLKSFEVRVVNKLPKVGLSGILYLVDRQDAEDGEIGNLFNEYLYINDKWELIGSSLSQIDLKEYVTNTTLNDEINTLNEKIENKVTITEEITEKLDTKQDNLTPGYGISIKDNVISVTIHTGDGTDIDMDDFVLRKDYMEAIRKYDEEITDLKKRIDEIEKEHESAGDLMLSFAEI